MEAGVKNVLLDGFKNRRISTRGTEINLKVAGKGPALLLLHGYPQTHVIWHKIAPELAKTHTVVVPDLRGYGDSGKPVSDSTHAAYSKRAMAADQVEVMDTLGFNNFSVVGHDRGGRVAHRMVRDYPDRIDKITVLDIAPTATMYAKTDMKFATAYYHWFLLIQPFDLPERMIGADPGFYLSKKIGAWGRTDGAISDEAFSEYLRCFSDPDTIHATCEDYRASATIDLEHDAVDRGRKIDNPLLVLWGQDGFVGKTYDVLDTWREVASNVSGHPVPGGHYVPEEAPQETLNALKAFL
ncbi:MAG: alpha/beta hydrolase [Hyphomicrobiales bacterium]|nr:alpha/beta hydrolase [Hyphomicrobiales bacterium]